MRLIIAEKKEVARAIAEAMGADSSIKGSGYWAGNDCITWLSGHLLRLKTPEEFNPELKDWRLEHLPMQWEIGHTVGDNTRAEEWLKGVSELIKKADTLVNAGDPDPEGQRLVDEVIEYARAEHKPCQRVLINDNSKGAILKAFQHLEDNKKYHGLSMSALARAVGDQRYGFNLTRLYTLMARKKGLENTLSVGRVQTPILGLVVRRDRANSSHEKQAYFTIRVQVALGAIPIKAVYQPSETAPVDDKNRVIDEGFAKEVVEAVNQKNAIVEQATTQEKQRAAPLPYNLLALQAEAAGKFGYSPSQVLEITQSLRDRHRAITYNRSDCRYLNDERHEEAAELLQALADRFDEAKKANSQLKSKAFNSKEVTAHHAIIPTLNVPAEKQLSTEENNIYQLIATLYIAQFYEPERYRVTTLLLLSEGHRFKASGRVNIASGWTVLYESEPDKNEEEESEESANYEAIKQGDTGRVDQANYSKDFTKPLPLYTMKSLLGDLARVAKYVTDPHIKALLLDKDADKKNESGGIGTPATRDMHIETLFKRGYITEKGKQVVSTSLGQQFFDALPAFATNPDLTALWHEKQKLIEKGELHYQELLKEIDAAVEEEVTRVKEVGLSMEATGIKCPTCSKGILRRKKGKESGFWWGCSAYPECRATFEDKRGKPVLEKKQPPLSNHLCPQCQKPLSRRPAKEKGKFWWGCSGYPDCKFTTFDNDGKPKF